MITKNIKYYLLTFILATTIYCGQAQQYGPSDPPGGPEQNPPLGGGAPLGGGVEIMLILGAAYGIRKLYVPTVNSKKVE